MRALLRYLPAALLLAVLLLIGGIIAVNTCRYTRQSREDVLLRRVDAIYEDVASRPYADEELSAEYCSKDWNATEDLVRCKDEALSGELGFFDSAYWIQGQDYADVNIRDLQIESIAKSRAEVRFILNNLGDDTPMRLVLIKEDGQWRIDNFITLSEPTYDWKAEMKDYLR